MPSDSSTTTNPSFLQPYSVVTKFDGSLKLDIDSLIKEIEEFIVSTGTPRSDNGFDKKCLNAVHSRLDLTSPKVREAFHAFDQQPNPSWELFKQEFGILFRPSQVDHVLQLARIFSLRPQSFSYADLRAHCNRVRLAVNKWISSIPENSLSNIKGAFRDTASHNEYMLYFTSAVFASSLTPLCQEKVWREIGKIDNVVELPDIFSKAVKEVAGNDVHVTNALSAKPTPPPQPQSSTELVCVPTRQPNPPLLPLPARPNPRSSYYPRMPGRYAATPNSPYQNTPIPRPLFRPPAVTNWIPEKSVCHKCLHHGHFSRDCRNIPVCPFHNIYGHPWYQCKDYTEQSAITQGLLTKARRGSSPHKTQKSCHFLEELLEDPQDTPPADPSPDAEIMQSPWDSVLN